MRLFLLADLRSNWYPRNAVDAFRRLTGVEIVARPAAADIVWIFDFYVSLAPILRWGRLGELLDRGGNRGRRQDLADKLVVGSFHHLTPWKEGEFLPRLRQIDRVADVIHFFSAANAERSRHYFTKPVITLPYWIDLGGFRRLPAEERQRLRRSLGLPADRMVIGSFQRDTELAAGAPKLEKGPDILCDVLEGLDREKIFALLAGPRRGYVEGRLARAGIAFKSLGHVGFERMNELYNVVDRYLVTSRIEGGPQAVLECMATETPIYARAVGIAEVLDPAVILDTAEDFRKALAGPYPDVLKAHRRTVGAFECARVIRLYEAEFARLLERLRAAPSPLAAGYRATRESG